MSLRTLRKKIQMIMDIKTTNSTGDSVDKFSRLLKNGLLITLKINSMENMYGVPELHRYGVA